MKFRCIVTLMGLILATSLLAQSTTAPAANRVAIFNGKDITGWRVWLENDAKPEKPVWSVADSVLKFDTTLRGYIITEKEYSNYHLHVEWRWPVGAVGRSNSGVLVHTQPPDYIWTKSFEVQLQTNNAGQVVGMDLDIPDAPMLQNRKRAPRLTNPSEKPIGEWNMADIHCKGNTIEVFINGTKQNYVDKLPISEGKICLQMEGFPIEFRNIWLEQK